MAALLGACTASQPSSPWESRLAPALCSRAEEQLSAKDPNAAKLSATQALEQARAQKDALSEARALGVLGLINQSRGQLDRAAQLMLDVPWEEDSGWLARLAFAQLAIQNDAPEDALATLEPLVDRTADWADVHKRALAEARAYHMLATLGRQQGQLEDARKHQRWAALQISVLPDGELARLRRQIAQALGDDYAAQALFEQAFIEHARAANMAAKLNEPLARLQATRSMSRDLVLLDRLADAVDHYGRTLGLARELDDWTAMGDVAREALHWLDAHGEPWDSTKRRLFVETLQELDLKAHETALDRG